MGSFQDWLFWLLPDSTWSYVESGLLLNNRERFSHDSRRAKRAQRRPTWPPRVLAGRLEGPGVQCSGQRTGKLRVGTRGRPCAGCWRQLRTTTQDDLDTASHWRLEHPNSCRSARLLRDGRLELPAHWQSAILGRKPCRTGPERYQREPGHHRDRAGKRGTGASFPTGHEGWHSDDLHRPGGGRRVG